MDPSTQSSNSSANTSATGKKRWTDILRKQNVIRPSIYTLRRRQAEANMPKKKSTSKKAAVFASVEAPTTAPEPPRTTRATRSSVRAGSAALEELPEPPKRASRKRSTSVSVTNSQPQSVITSEPSPPPTASSLEQETCKTVSHHHVSPEAQMEDKVRREVVERERSQRLAELTIPDGKIILEVFVDERMSFSELTRPELEAMTTELLVQKKQTAIEMRTQNDHVNRIERSIENTRAENRDMYNHIRHLKVETHKGTLRRFYSVESPAAKLKEQKRQESEAAAEKKRKEIEAAAATLKEKEKENRVKEAILREREAKVAEEEARKSEDVLPPKTPRTATRSLFEELPPTHTESPSSWGLSFIFNSAKKLLGSPAKRPSQARSSRLNVRVPPSIQEEESPRVCQEKPQQSKESVEARRKDQDLSQIVRKRKAIETPQDQTPKKTKLNGVITGSFDVPSSDESEGDAVVTDHSAKELTPTSRNTSARHAGHAHDEPHTSQSSQPVQALSPTKNRTLTSPQTPSKKTARTLRGLSSPNKSSQTPNMQLPETPNKAAATPLGTSSQQTQQTPQESSADEVAMEPPPTVRRSVKSVRAKREADGIAKANAANPNMVYIPLTKRYVRRPLMWELIGFEDFQVQEELDAAVEAMLTIEEAEDHHLPIPKLTVKPAQRKFERERPAGAPRSSFSSFTVDRDSSFLGQGLQKPKKAPREPNADKREAQLKINEEKAAERKRLQEKAQHLREEQLKAEEELRRLEEDGHEVGKKRKRVKIDELKTIPSRRPGQGTGTFALLEEYFDEEDSVEMDEDEIELIEPRPTKLARTETNIFAASTDTTSSTTTTPQNESLAQQQAGSAINPAPQHQSSSAATHSFALGTTPSAQQSQNNTPGQPKTGSSGSPSSTIAPAPAASGVQPAGNIFAPAGSTTDVAKSTAALDKARAAAEKYKPTAGSRLREVQRHSTSASLTDSPQASLINAAGSASTPEPHVIKKFSFPSAEAIFAPEIVKDLPKRSPEHQAMCLAKFRAGLAARFPEGVEE